MALIWIVPIAFAALIIAVQIGTLRGLGRGRLVGDEGEYLRRGRSDDPYAPEPFLRVPLMSFIARRVAGTADPEGSFRAILAGASVLTVLVTSTAGWLLGGVTVGCVVGVILLLSPERLILGNHIWPDSLLGLWLALISLLLIAMVLPAPLQAMALGAVAALGLLTRFDALILCPLVVVAWWLSYGRPDGSELLGLVIPVGVTFAVLCWRNWRRYGIAFPDTTAMFNITVMGSEVGQGSGEEFTLDSLVSQTGEQWRAQGRSDRRIQAARAVRTLLSRPGAALRGMFRRMWAFCGPETFISEKLFGKAKGAYLEINPSLRAGLRGGLRFSFPLVLCLAVVTHLMNRPFAAYYILPTAGMFVAAFLFHMRTRYRLALLPGLSVMAADGGLTTWRRLETLTTVDVLVAVAGIALFLALTLTTARREMPTTTST